MKTFNKNGQKNTPVHRRAEIVWIIKKKLVTSLYCIGKNMKSSKISLRDNGINFAPSVAQKAAAAAAAGTEREQAITAILKSRAKAMGGEDRRNIYKLPQ